VKKFYFITDLSSYVLFSSWVCVLRVSSVVLLCRQKHSIRASRMTSSTAYWPRPRWRTEWTCQRPCWDLKAQTIVQVCSFASAFVGSSHSLANRHSCLTTAKNQEHRYRQCRTNY